MRSEVVWQRDVTRLTDQSALACFLFMVDPGNRAANWSRPPIASGRFTRGRLAAYWLDGFVLVPRKLADRDIVIPIEENEPREL